MKFLYVAAGALIATATLCAPAVADPIDQQATSALELADQPQTPTPANGRTAMGDETLGALSAGDSNTYQVMAGQQLTATAEGNTIEGDVDTGDVTIEAGALSAFSGVGNFVNNTGANSNLNGSIMVNIVGASVTQ